MKKQTLVMTASIVGILTLFIAAGIFAGTTVPDSIKMQNKAYDKHTKPIVEFHHKKHAEEYAKKNPDLYKNGCGECHHDDKGKPLADLKVGDDVKGCIECHKTPGELSVKDKKELRKSLSKEALKTKELEYHAEAIHENCRGCHRNYNKKHNLKSKDEGYAPTTCTKCHEK